MHACRRPRRRSWSISRGAGCSRPTSSRSSGKDGRSKPARASGLVGLERPEAVFDEDGKLISDAPYTRATEAPALQASLDRLNLGMKFGKFLGDAYSFLIETPVGLLHKQIEGALSGLEGFSFVEPNAIMQVAATPVGSATGSISVANAALGIRYVNILSDVGVNVRVMNASFGGPSGSSTLQQRIEEAEDRGILFVTAAGNNGFNNQSGGWDNDKTDGTQAVYPSSYTTGNIISVAASTRNDQKAAFSNWGATSVDLFAPGEDIATTLMDGTYTTTADGTSFAAPMVAGVAALVFSMNPAAPLATIRDAILDNVDTKSAFSGLVETGGRLNAYNTIQAISTADGFSRIVLGDHQGAARNDDLYVYQHPSDSTKTQVGRWDTPLGQYVVLATLSNVSTQKIAVFGLDGHDIIRVASTGVNNPVYFVGGDGNDTLSGNATNDTLIGEAGNDSIVGGMGHDMVIGSSGNDILSGNLGNDTLLGEGGNDQFHAYDSNGNIDSLVGGPGTDTLMSSNAGDILEGIEVT